LQNLGVSIENVKTDPIGDAFSVGRTLNEAELAQLNQTVGQLYANFTAKVAEGRKLAPDAADAVARGRIWSGLAAKSRGLVDELGGFAKAVELARAKAGLTIDQPHDLVLYPPPGLLGTLSLTWARADGSGVLSTAANLLELPPRWAPALLYLMTRPAAILHFCPIWR
jgi:protease-4